LGRFGWKAGNPDVMQQSAGALNQDMGITNMVFPEESSYGQIQYDGRADEPEISDSLLYSIAFYMRTLAVPAARHRDRPEVTEGRTIFKNLGCVSCHRQKLHTGTDVAFPPVSNQDIYPYTDLLLHDMGPGLADHRPEFRADGSEWRTSPLWGIGLTRIVNGHTNFLHDGRARSLEEAILWHGGEAASAVQKFTQLNSRDRQKLLSFLNSL
ncbi:MAG: thiol oxidoreductase, partial [Bacteroidia bacterium]|nr:thiol oxidoreductase [Bacteroidia bacterium]